MSLGLLGNKIGIHITRRTLVLKDRLDKNYLITKSKEDLTFPVLESILESINPIS